MVSISFAVSVCTEALELKRLLKQLKSSLNKEDEIVIQIDVDNTNQEVLDVLSNENNISKIFFGLNKDFARFKNNLFDKCSKSYIFQIDADEEVNKDQIDLIKQVLELNPTVDCFLVPRINTVKGLTQEHIQKWNWRVDDQNRINFPDYQYRICKNTPTIKWKGKVHETLEGYEQLGMLPAEEIYALGHHKTIEKQEKQNSFYNTI
jgi:glycosyltransferase involved in cell wall biosynthesis